jgi:hypothetical protein
MVEYLVYTFIKKRWRRPSRAFVVPHLLLTPTLAGFRGSLSLARFGYAARNDDSIEVDVCGSAGEKSGLDVGSVFHRGKR